MAVDDVTKNYGFTPPIITEDNYVLGGLGVEKKVINPERSWLINLPVGERQRRSIETNSCTAYGTLNAIEALESRMYGLDSRNYSERAVAIGSGQTQQGNDPHRVAEYIRKNGLLEEQWLPFTDSIVSFIDYLNPKPLPNGLLAKSKEWLKKRNFKHEWVFTGGSLKQKQEKLWEALQYSPVGVSVKAWKQRDGKHYKEQDESDNHWCLLVAARYGEEWLVYDSYIDDGYIKVLEWDYNFNFAKLYIIGEPEKITFWEKIKTLWHTWVR